MAEHGRIIASDYVAPRWLVGAHMQTIWPAIIQPPARVKYHRERVDTPDGDFWDFDWLNNHEKVAPDTPLIILFHGLEGNSRSHYACAMMSAIEQRGWRGVVPHYRGCSGELNRGARAYHMGDYADVNDMLHAISSRVSPQTPIFALGVSLGGSALVNWLGRNNESVLLKAAAAISTPLDLPSCGKALDSIHGYLYTKNFLATLKPKAIQLGQNHPEKKIDVIRLSAVRTLSEFDDYFTAPIHGFIDHHDYWQKASPRPWLAKINIPTLVLNARNDPMVPETTLPTEQEISAKVTLERPSQGGHAGFPTHARAEHAWMPRRVLSFFEKHL